MSALRYLHAYKLALIKIHNYVCRCVCVCNCCHTWHFPVTRFYAVHVRCCVCVLCSNSWIVLVFAKVYFKYILNFFGGHLAIKAFTPTTPLYRAVNCGVRIWTMFSIYLVWFNLCCFFAVILAAYRLRPNCTC